MKVEVIDYNDIKLGLSDDLQAFVSKVLHDTGIIGIKNIPEYAQLSKQFIVAARQFSALDETIKRQYAPERDKGLTEGYELGAEKFIDSDGQWQIDDKKASFYAYVHDNPRNKWPDEIDLRTPYLQLAQLMFASGKILLNAIGLNESMGISHDELVGYGRMLHYHKESDSHNVNPNWCGAHLDHGLFTALMPAYYFQDGVGIAEPDGAGLYIRPSNGRDFVKVDADDTSILYFQVGEFAQLASDDRIKATKHLVKKAKGNVERFTLAVFFDAASDTLIRSNSEIALDMRYANNANSDGEITYLAWSDATYAYYHAK